MELSVAKATGPPAPSVSGPSPNESVRTLTTAGPMPCHAALASELGKPADLSLGFQPSPFLVNALHVAWLTCFTLNRWLPVGLILTIC